MKIAVIGTGYVGLVAGVLFSTVGNDVICVDKNPEIINKLKNGIPTIHEPGLEELMKKSIQEPSSYDKHTSKLDFTTDIKKAIQNSDIIFIAVGTPMNDEGKADLSAVRAVAESIAENINGYKVIVNKSTVPVGTARMVEDMIRTKHNFAVVSNPEFLKEGNAIKDFSTPDRVIIGYRSDQENIIPIFKQLYGPFMRKNERIFFMSRESAEITKYAANAMLATRISFINEIARLAEKAGANIDDIRLGIGTDSRIGSSFLYAGPGYGGSCFPKDVLALMNTADDYGVDLEVVKATHKANQTQKCFVINKVIKEVGSDIENMTFAIWGLSFKANTDDIRESVSIDLIKELLIRNATIKVYDPEAIGNTKKIFQEKIVYSDCQYDCIDGADILIVMTEWNEFRSPNLDMLKKLKTKTIFDLRNLYDSQIMKNTGFNYHSIGRQ